MYNSQDPEVEIETLNEDDLDSISGGNEDPPLREPNTGPLREPNT